MADKKISQLTALSAANLAPSTDVLAIVDTSATETKKIVAQDLINGVLNVASAVGIGTASPTEKLTVSGNATVTGSGRFQSGGSNWMEFATNVLTSNQNDGAHIRSVISAEATPTYSFKGDEDTGIFHPGANILAFTTGSTERMRLTSSVLSTDSSINVGIGTASPASKLDTAGTIRATSQTVPSSGTGAELFYDATNAGLRGYNRTGSAYVNLALNDNVYIGGGSSGNVGIGTTSPAQKLDVDGGMKGGVIHRKGTYSAGATTPSVSGVSYLDINNSSATSITNFTGAVEGQMLMLVFRNANTTITRNNAYLAGSVNFTSATNATLTLVYDGTSWFEVCRSTLNG